jgi:hypothetical protein
MADAPTTWLLVNAASGSNDDQAVGELEQALVGAGIRPQRTVRLPDEPAPERDALDAAGVELLVIFTGDGTANRVVTGLYGWAGEVLVLPGGTQNLLARELHGETPVAQIVAGLGHGALRPVRRPLIRCSAGDALVEIVAGPGAAWSDVRESLREGDLGEIAATTREAIGKSAGGPTVVVSEPPLGNPEGYTAVRIHPQGDGKLAVDGYGAQGVLDYAKHGLALLKRDFREGPHDELGRHPAVTCRSPDPIELMIDGERARGLAEERFATTMCDLAFLGSGSEHA